MCIRDRISSPSGAGTTYKYGLIKANDNWTVGEGVFDSGIKPADVAVYSETLTTEQVLMPGKYFSTLWQDGGPSVRGYRGSLYSSSLIPGLGSSPTFSLMFNLGVMAVPDFTAPSQTPWTNLNTTTTVMLYFCLLYTSPSPRDRQKSRMPSSA